jgi:hypothetical protein
MNKSILFASIAIAFNANAAQVEIGGGISQTKSTDDQIWWQSGAPNKRQMVSPMFTAGMVGDSWRAGYMYLGKFSIDSLDAATYDVKPGAYNPCNILTLRNLHDASCAYFSGSGKVQGLYALWTPSLGKGFKLEVGPYVHTATWTEKIYMGGVAQCQGLPAYQQVAHANKIHVDPIFGISYDISNHVSIAADYIKLGTSSSNSDLVPTGYKNAAFTVDLRVRF